MERKRGWEASKVETLSHTPPIATRPSASLRRACTPTHSSETRPLSRRTHRASHASSSPQCTPSALRCRALRRPPLARGRLAGLPYASARAASPCWCRGECEGKDRLCALGGEEACGFAGGRWDAWARGLCWRGDGRPVSRRPCTRPSLPHPRPLSLLSPSTARPRWGATPSPCCWTSASSSWAGR